MANYAKCQTFCNLLFAMFAILIISSRLGVYPVWILNTTLFESWEIIGPYPSRWVFNLLLILLQLLHSFWSYLIVKTACSIPAGMEHKYCQKWEESVEMYIEYVHYMCVGSSLTIGTFVHERLSI